MTALILPSAIGIVAGQAALAYQASRSTECWRLLTHYKTVCSAVAGIVLASLALYSGLMVASSLGVLAFACKSWIHIFWAGAGAIVMVAALYEAVMKAIHEAHALRDKADSSLLSCVFNEGAKISPSPLQNKLEGLFVGQALCSLGLAICGVSPLVFLTLAGLQLAAAKFISERIFVCFTTSKEQAFRMKGHGGQASDLRVAYSVEVIFPKDVGGAASSSNELVEAVEGPLSPVQLRYETKIGDQWTAGSAQRQTVSEIAHTVEGVLSSCFSSAQRTLASYLTVRTNQHGGYDGYSLDLSAKLRRSATLNKLDKRVLEEFQLFVNYYVVFSSHGRTDREAKATDREVEITWQE